MLNPEFAIGRGIRRTMPDFFFRKKLNRMQRYAFAFFVKKASASFASVLAPIAKSGIKNKNPPTKNRRILFFCQGLFRIGYTFLMFAALGPLLESITSNSTLSPSANVLNPSL